LKLQKARADLANLLPESRVVGGIKVFARAIPEIDRASMRSLADELKNRLGTGVVILGAPQEDKVALIVMVSTDLAKRLPAGKIVKELAPLVGGSGGGKPELAEAGGKDSAGLADAIEQSYVIVRRLLGDKF
jgi:alanyl-tRNA synthetase